MCAKKSEEKCKMKISEKFLLYSYKKIALNRTSKRKLKKYPNN